MASNAVKILRANPAKSDEEIAELAGCKLEDLASDKEYMKLDASLSAEALDQGMQGLYRPNGPYPNVTYKPGSYGFWSTNERGKPVRHVNHIQTPSWLGNNLPVWRSKLMPLELTERAICEWQNASRDDLEADRQIDLRLHSNEAQARYDDREQGLIEDAKLLRELVCKQKNPETSQIRERLDAFIELRIIHVLSSSSAVAEQSQVESRNHKEDSSPITAPVEAEMIPRGFLGGAALADALGVHPSKHDAFFKKLERKRLQMGDESWQEVNNRKANSPRYQYRTDSMELHKLAEEYKTPRLD